MDYRSARRHHQLRVRLSAVLRVDRLRASRTAPTCGGLRRAQARTVRRGARSRRAAQRTADPCERDALARSRAIGHRLSLRPARAAQFLFDLLGGLHEAHARSAAHGFRSAPPLLRLSSSVAQLSPPGQLRTTRPATAPLHAPLRRSVQSGLRPRRPRRLWPQPTRDRRYTSRSLAQSWLGQT